MQTYLNSPDLKTRFLEQIAFHEDADQLIKGSYGEGTGREFRGCAIGCSLHSLNIISGKKAKTGDHSRYERELGLPIWLAYLEDNIFENLPLDQAKQWPRRFAEAIPVGAVVDDMVLAKILRWALADATFGVRFATDDEEIRRHIDVIVAMFDAEIATGGQASAGQREAAARAARAARDAWDARDARDAWDARAARAAWDAWAAWDARDARAAWAARDARDARAAWAARDARAAWAASLNPEVKKADAFFPSLSAFVLDLLRALPSADAAATQAMPAP
jgi:hypothetical protein